MNRIEQNSLYAFTMVELLVIMMLSGAFLLSVMEGMSLFRKYGSAIAGRIGRNSVFFADYGRLEGMVGNADSIREAGRGEFEVYYAGRGRYRLVEKDSVLIAYAGDFRDTMSVKISGLSMFSGKEGFPTAGGISVIVVTSGGKELPLSFRTEQSMRNESIMDMVEKENKYRRVLDKQEEDDS